MFLIFVLSETEIEFEGMIKNFFRLMFVCFSDCSVESKEIELLCFFILFLAEINWNDFNVVDVLIVLKLLIFLDNFLFDKKFDFGVLNK